MGFHICFLQRLYNELKEHKPSVEAVNRNGGKFIREAKISVTRFNSWNNHGFISGISDVKPNR